MILTRSTGSVILSLMLLAAVPAASASAKKSKPRPKVTSVAPLSAGIGDQLTIRGKNFVLGKKRNTVLFKNASGKIVSAKSVQSTRKVIYVVVPKGLLKNLTVKGGVAQPTRFRLRVLSRRFAKKFTTLKWSPTIGPASTILGPGKTAPPDPDCDNDGVLNTADGDDDNDLLSDALEAILKLGNCDADSDSDGSEDGYEYQSALDLNSTGGALPYPGKRPYPNPLDGTDGRTDYDGDGLYMDQEQLLWRTYGNHTLVLNYSAGKKKTPAAAGPNDDNRDGDGDGLGNWDEFNGPFQPDWWRAIYGETPYDQPYHGLSAVDPDSDGDSLPDGVDDIDHDGYSNAAESFRGALMVQPFNPCLPEWFDTPTCSEHPPVSSSYPPFDIDMDTTMDGFQMPPSPVPWPRPEPITPPPPPPAP